MKTDWQCHGEGDSILDGAVIADHHSSDLDKYIGRVATEDGDCIIGKVSWSIVDGKYNSR